MEGARLRVVAGSAYRRHLARERALAALLRRGAADRGAELRVPDGFTGRAAYVVEGSIACDGQAHRTGTMLVFRGAAASLTALEPTQSDAARRRTARRGAPH